jgi:hypothetical protein
MLIAITVMCVMLLAGQIAIWCRTDVAAATAQDAANAASAARVDAAGAQHDASCARSNVAAVHADVLQALARLPRTRAKRGSKAPETGA